VEDVLTRPDENGTTAPSGMAEIEEQIAGQSIAPGASLTVTYTHVVAEEDLGGELTNKVTVTAKPEIEDPTPDPENPEDPRDEDTETVITDDPTNCTITVTKRIIDVISEDLIIIGPAEFYVALFEDAALTKRVGEVQTLTYGENQATAQTVFTELKRGTYYVAETDASGNVTGEMVEFDGGVYSPKYPNGNTVVITDNGGTAELSFEKSFLVMPSGYYKAKTLTITKNVYNIEGDEMETDETFYAGIFADAEFTQLADNVSQNIAALEMGGSSSVSVNVEVSVPNDGKEVTLYITEVDADGTPVATGEGFEYEVEVDGSEVTLTVDSEDAETVITNTSTVELETEETETEETEPADDTAVDTGDATPLFAVMATLLASAALFLLLADRRRRQLL